MLFNECINFMQYNQNSFKNVEMKDIISNFKCIALQLTNKSNKYIKLNACNIRFSLFNFYTKQCFLYNKHKLK